MLRYVVACALPWTGVAQGLRGSNIRHVSEVVYHA